MPRLLFTLVLLAGLGLPALAQDKEKDNAEAVQKQKASAVENLKTLKITKPATVETESLLVYADMPQDKLKPIAEAVQKTFDRGVKDLKFGEKDRLWSGKLTVYVLGDRPTEYTRFVKLVEQRSGKLDADEMQSHGLKPQPYVAVTAAPGARTAEADLRSEAATAVVAALVDQKAGAALPSWLHTGMGKAIVYRTEGNTKLMEVHKTKVKGLFTKTRVGTFKAGDLWGDTRSKDADTLAVSMGEYLLYGADAAKVGMFLGGFKTSEDRPEANVMTALDAAGWKTEDLDVAWKRWVMGLK